jgi:putative transposon-encoded protein
MTKASFTTDEIKGVVKAWGHGGAYVSVPKAWVGKRVKVEVIEEE